MTLGVIIPVFRLDKSEARRKALEFVIGRVLKYLAPDTIVVTEQLDKGGRRWYSDTTSKTVYHHTFGPLEHGEFNKAMAVNRGVDHCRTDIVLVLDADVVLNWKTVGDATAALKRGELLKPFNRVVRLNEATTSTIYSGTFMVPEESNADISNVVGGGAFAVHRADYLAIGGMDTEFYGWGWEDRMFGDACLTAGYKVVQLDLPGYHLFHERDKPALLASESAVRNHKLYLAKTLGDVSKFDLNKTYTVDDPPPPQPLDHKPNIAALGSCAIIIPIFPALVKTENAARVVAIEHAISSWFGLQQWVPQVYIYEAVYGNAPPLLAHLSGKNGIFWRPVSGDSRMADLFQKEALVGIAIEERHEDRLLILDGDVFSLDPWWFYKCFYPLSKANHILVQPMQWLADTVVGREQWSYAMADRIPGKAHYHPGLGMAFNRKWLLSQGGMNPYCITGSGDTMFWGEFCPETLRLSPSWNYKWIPSVMRKDRQRAILVAAGSSVFHKYHGEYAKRAYTGSRYLFDLVGGPKEHATIHPKTKLLIWRDPKSFVRRLLRRRDEMVDVATTIKLVAEERAR